MTPAESAASRKNGRVKSAASRARYQERGISNARPLEAAQHKGRTIMSTFDKREENFEAKFAHDEELRFKAHARRNKLAGQWAAEKLGLAGAEAEAYASNIVTIDLDKPDSDRVFSQIRKDFDAKGVAQSDHQIRRTLEECLEKAIADIKAGHH
jgi:hypothetical protein